MNYRYILLPVLLLILSGCQPAPNPPSPGENAAMPNPASVHCEENGGKLEIREDADGGQYGICIFPDGSECDEWAYFRGECATASASQPQPTAESAPTVPPVEQPAGGWQIYRDDVLGYSFQYPPDCVVEPVEGAPGSLTIHGTAAGNEFWPQFTVNHPDDREEFRPPEDAVLEQWLSGHNLMPDEHLPDVNIAGTTAVHLRHERSPQSYAFDRFYFAHAGQLYEIVIGHVGDHEDWELYNRFLESFAFAP